MAVCPRCGSRRFKYELRSAGAQSSSNYYRTGIKSSLLLPKRHKTYRSKRRVRSVGICPDCGYIQKNVPQPSDTIIGYVFLVVVILIIMSSLSK